MSDGSSRCPRHPHQPWAKRPDAPRRVTGRALQQQRALLFAHHPLCAECELRGRVTLATDRDHIVPLAEGGADVPANIQGLCASCHKAKTATESARGRAKAGGGGG